MDARPLDADDRPSTRVPEFPIAWARARFPALAAAEPFVFLDNAGGSQVPEAVADAVGEHLLRRNVQRAARYARSREVDEVLDLARRRTAAFLGADDPAEVSFGLNATSLMRMVSLALAPSLREGRDEIIVTDLDHHANIAAWLALEAFGARIRWWRIREDHALHLEDLEPLLTPRTRLLAMSACSHALGVRPPAAAAARLVRAAGGELFLDAVHASPHLSLDVAGLGCDYLVCSAYKAFGPHLGYVWGRREALDRLRSFRAEFIPDVPPAKFEAGTLPYESLAGLSAAFGYLEDLGARLDPDAAPGRPRLVSALRGIEAWERRLGAVVLEELAASGARVFGPSDPREAAARVPTVAFTLLGTSPGEAAERLGRAGFGVRDGHLYAPRLMERLGLPLASGAVRVSLLHYNTPEEARRFGAALRGLGA